MIPRRIIQTARTGALDPLARAAATNLKLLHPDWDYEFFDDARVASFVATEFPEHAEVFAAFPRAIQRVDFFRYLAVYRLGGFYFDLDVFLSRPLTPLLAHEAVFPFEELTLNRHLRAVHGLDWELGNYAFGAEPGHPFFAAVIENCGRAVRDPAWVAPMMASIPRWFRTEFQVLNTTGPGLLSRTYAEHPALTRRLTILFPPDVCAPDAQHQFGDYGVHAMSGSWRERGSWLWRKAALWWEVRERRRLLPASRRLGPTRPTAVEVPS